LVHHGAQIVLPLPNPLAQVGHNCPNANPFALIRRTSIYQHSVKSPQWTACFLKLTILFGSAVDPLWLRIKLKASKFQSLRFELGWLGSLGGLAGLLSSFANNKC
jgi:hypothetical protein